MKKFVFSLEKVLNFKNQTLEVLKNELAILQREMEALEAQIAKMQQVLSDTNIELTARMSEGVNAVDITIYKVYLNDISANIKKKVEEKTALGIKIAKKQIEIVGANIEIASLDKLKEKQFEEYRQEAAKAQEIELNEFINNLSIT